MPNMPNRHNRHSRPKGQCPKNKKKLGSPPRHCCRPRTALSRWPSTCSSSPRAWCRWRSPPTGPAGGETSMSLFLIGDSSCSFLSSLQCGSFSPAQGQSPTRHEISSGKRKNSPFLPDSGLRPIWGYYSLPLSARRVRASPRPRRFLRCPHPSRRQCRRRRQPRPRRARCSREAP